MSAIKKLAAIFLAVAVVASSVTIFAGVGPAVDFLASFEKEYEKHIFKAESDLLNLVETPGVIISEVKLEGQARK